MGFCLSIGLLSACWGGHAVFPNLKTDMRHPEKFKDCLKTTYKITSMADIGTAVVGFLMFGNLVHDEITKNLLLTAGYPNFVYGTISALMAVIPIAKTPLNARPIVSVLDTLMGIEGAEAKFEGRQFYFAKFQRIFNRILINVLFVTIAIVFPKFDKLIAFLGAGLCFAICLILPCLFYIKICKATIKPWEKRICHLVIFCQHVSRHWGLVLLSWHNNKSSIIPPGTIELRANCLQATVFFHAFYLKDDSVRSQRPQWTLNLSRAYACNEKLCILAFSRPHTCEVVISN